MAALPSRHEVAEAGGHAPHSAYAERSAFEAVPARLSGSTSVLKLVSRHGAAARVSPDRTARVAVPLVPEEIVEPRGIAPRSTQCHCVVLLLDDGPEMERAPGLAPGKSGFASRRLDDFGIARFWKWGGRRVL